MVNSVYPNSIPRSFVFQAIHSVRRRILPVCTTPSVLISSRANGLYPKGVQGLPPNVHQMIANQSMSIRPPAAPTVEAEGIDRFHPVVTSLEGLSLSEDVQARFEAAKGRVAEMERERQNNNECPGADVRIITLGTGSACPNKYRNGMFFVSHILALSDLSCSFWDSYYDSQPRKHSSRLWRGNMGTTCSSLWD